jgi:hypothetical protein
MTLPTFGPITKRVIVEFLGGDADGLYLDTKHEDREIAQYTEFLYVGTQNGTVGRGVRGLSMSLVIRVLKGDRTALNRQGLHAHEYRVVERIEEDNEILLRMKYKGQIVSATNLKPNQED